MAHCIVVLGTIMGLYHHHFHHHHGGSCPPDSIRDRHLLPAPTPEHLWDLSGPPLLSVSIPHTTVFTTASPLVHRENAGGLCENQEESATKITKIPNLLFSFHDTLHLHLSRCFYLLFNAILAAPSIVILRNDSFKCKYKTI